MHKRPNSLALLIVLAVLSILSSASAPGVSADDLDQEVRSIAKRLQCPICESVTVADSPSELAVQMRAIIRSKLEQGQSNDEIVSYFVERYGESVLVEPPRHGVGLIVWLGPLAALLMGATALAFWFLKARSRSTLESPPRGPLRPALADWQLSAAQRELDDMGRGRSG